MNKYEIVFIVRADLDEKAVLETSKTEEKILKDMKAEITNFKDLGQKKLAYPINKQIRGYYFLMNVNASADAIKEFDRRSRIDEKILRHLIIKEEE